ncbi:Fibronectin type III domain protein [Aspergillus clavatus NRRL 1]|uniref:Fibronectin type III domain protein n=1 Tax=Aspergillus clavatus (strain ATCC 1007 / CBS 513.65 / DSM 816 / NCTC 3887 / NRRL 1 / QM 1276 / 107) TaxID=344612 RepID=A1CP02_ASPCL|nr:Fibronectin type III domain protein [Aspergillus clavatus NRRL 1]EAW07373.1 Fibronectin type III domain protein [Aspergillus clavatus NRRL 1]
MALFLAVTILWALIWLLYRAWQVCQTPNDVLVEKLGLDIPPPPEVTLEEITAREIRIAWKQPDFHNSIHRHIIQVNGSKVGESKRAETVVEISNLVPGSIYHVCVFSVSAANFQTPSAIIHVRTKPLPLSPSQQNAPVGPPTIRASIPRPAAGLVAPSAPMMARELSGGQLQVKRSSAGRRQSPAASGVDLSHGQSEETQRNTTTSDINQSVERLAERLKTLQQENENVEKQAAEEEEEHVALLKELEKQRDELRKRVKEKDEASGDLKKHVNKLESVNRTVQNEKAKRERLLQQKETERNKRREDIIRWREEMVRMTAEVTQINEEKAQVEDEGKRSADEIREKIAKEQAEMKVLDDEIQDKGGRVKKLEEERKRQQGGDSEDGRELDRIDNERARQWEIKLNNLNARYASMVNLHAQVSALITSSIFNRENTDLSKAQQQYQDAQERLKWLTTQRPGSSGPFALPTLDMDLSNTATIRPRRHRSSLNSNVSSPMNFPSLEPSFPGGVNFNPPSTNSPTFAPIPAFFNINNGMTLPGLSDSFDAMRGELDLSFGNPQMSPRADALLPSDLLGDEESPEPPRPIIRPRFSNLDMSDPPLESFSRGPSSPESAASKPASIFASPHEDLNEPRPQSVHVVEVDDAPKSASRRLSGLFGFHRPRGKTLADEPPLLGTLKAGQSQSFPRNLDEMDPIGARRRRLSHTGNWANPISLLPRSNTAGVTADSSSDHLPSRRTAISSIFSPSRFGFGGGGGGANGGASGGGSSLLKSSEPSDLSSGYNQFSPRHDPIDPASILGTVRRGSLSPRPSSTFSFENQLPHPSTDHRLFGWGSAEKGHRSPLGFDWASPSTWSRAHSRRPSIQYGSSGHLPLGLTGEPDFPQESFERQGRPLQAPIGTRPSSSHRPVTPKLNPAAPSFKTIFIRKSDKDKDKERGRDRDADVPFDFHMEEGSPSESRISRDSRPRSLSVFTGDSYESLERMPSAASADNSTSKESFIRKITRKGSSSKFSSWKDRSGFFSKKGDSSQGDIDEDANSEAQLAKSIDSTISSVPSVDRSTRSSLGFFSRKSKKSDKAASETSERPSELASEMGDEELPEDTHES